MNRFHPDAGGSNAIRIANIAQAQLGADPPQFAVVPPRKSSHTFASRQQAFDNVAAEKAGRTSY
jgi:hypothetical protein